MAVTAEEYVEESTERPVSRGLLPYLPAAVAVLGAVLALLITDTPVPAILIYAGYFTVAVIIPGTLLYRLLLGYSDSLLSDVAWGSVTGLMLELVGWALFTLAGVNRFLWLWPALVLAVFALVPRLRPLWRRPPGSGSTSRVVAWSTTVASLLGWTYLAAIFYQGSQLPPKGPGYFVDLPWHLGVAYEATRSIPLYTPEASAEGILHYHWFADAHYGAASLITGLDLPTIVIRTGLFPLVFVLVATTVALAIKISRRPLVGAVAGVLVVATTAGAEYWARLYKMHVVFPESPTGIYSVGISCLVLALLVDLVRGGPRPRAWWALFAASAVAAVGSKPSVLLLFIPAVVVLMVVELLSGRGLNRPLLVALALMGAVFVMSLYVFASPGGSTVRPALIQVLVWRGRLQTSVPSLVATAVVKGYLLFLAAAVALVSRPLRSDPVARLLAAVSLVGVVAAWALYHPGMSQIFFWTSAIPFAVILTAWGLVLGLDRITNRRTAMTFVALTCVALFGSMLFVRINTGTQSRLMPGWLVLVVTAAGVAVVAFKLRVPALTTFLTWVAAAMAVSVPVTLALLPWQPVPSADNAHWAAQSEAVLWVEAHTPFRDTLATNSHCTGATVPHCDARSFWVSGFSGRRVLLGGYGVSPSALRRGDLDGYKAWRQPYHDQELLRLNDSAFEAPTVESLRRLYDQYGVRWLVADLKSGPVSPDLNRLAVLVYANDSVRVYKLDPAVLVR